MSMLKATTIFTYTSDGGRVAGWSESWYLPLEISNAAAFTALFELGKKRCRMLPAATQIKGYRITEVNDAAFSAGESRKSRTKEDGSPGAWVSADGVPSHDIPQMAIACVVDGDGVKNRKHYDLRGVGDSVVKGGAYTGEANFQSGFVQWASKLRSEGFRFRHIDLAQSLVGVKSIDVNGNFVLLSDMNFEIGNYIMLNRIKDVSGKPVNGVFVVDTKADARAGKFVGWKGQTVGQSGKVRRRNYLYTQVAAGTNEIKGATTHEVGRPSGLYVGRRSAKR